MSIISGVVIFMSKVLQRISDLGLVLPEVAKPVANYVSCVKYGNILYISGQLPKGNDGIIVGKLGVDISIDDAKQAAKLCALYLFSQVKNEIGDLDLIKKCVKLCIFVNSDQGFKDHSIVANGASDVMVDVLGDAGKHARSSIGVASLPFGACVEVEAIFELA